MKLEKVDLADTDCFSSSFLEYAKNTDSLKPYYGRFPTIANFKSQFEEKSLSPENRKLLHDVLVQQYDSTDTSESVSDNIKSLLDPDTYTVTTGHQLNIFTGPLYFIFKIVTVINACRQLSEKYPEKNFVPVYWMASEDHDFEEISHFRFHGEKFKWNSDQSGAVGRFDPSELRGLIENFPVQLPVFEKAYLNQNTLADSVREYVNELFVEYGLVVIDADDKHLKELLIPVMKADILDQVPQKCVNEMLTGLEKAGIKAPVNPREINFFCLEDGLRTRIEKSGDRFKLVDEEREFSKEELVELFKKSPEKFSPNVILRPLYQEMILPNLAYVGGPSELVYWLELKGVFDHFKVPFPILLPRNFAMIIPSHIDRKWNKTGFKHVDIFKKTHVLEKEATIKYSKNDLQLNGKTDHIQSTFDTIRDQAEKIDETLGPMVGAEAARAMKSLEKIEKKMIRAEKRRMKEKIGQMKSVKEFLFPGGGLQERKDNFLNFYLDDPEFIHQLVMNFDPFDLRFHILTYE